MEETEEMISIEEIELEPLMSYLKTGDVENGNHIILEITSIGKTKTKWGYRYEFVGRDVNNNPVCFSDWNITRPTKISVKIGAKLKLSNTGAQKLEATLL